MQILSGNSWYVLGSLCSVCPHPQTPEFFFPTETTFFLWIFFFPPTPTQHQNWNFNPSSCGPHAVALLVSVISLSDLTPFVSLLPNFPPRFQVWMRPRRALFHALTSPSPPLTQPFFSRPS